MNKYKGMRIAGSVVVTNREVRAKIKERIKPHYPNNDHSKKPEFFELKGFTVTATDPCYIKVRWLVQG